MFRAGQMESLSLIFRNHVKKPGVVVLPVTPALGSEMSASVGLTGSQPTSLGEFQSSETPCLEK